MAAATSSLDAERRAARAKVVETRAALLRSARVNGAAFAAYVLRDEETGSRIELADMHTEWHDLIDTHDRLLLWSHVEAGKSSGVSVGRTLFELGRDSSKRIVILSKTQGQSVKIVRSIASYIERSGALREVFPNLYPSVPWTSTSLIIQRDVFSKDFSVQACGVGGVIVGARIDILIIDDILDWKNTRTPAQRAELLRWFRSEFIGRLTSASRVIVCGNAYHPEDFLNTLAREGYTSRTYPVTDEKGEPRFPRKWSKARIAAKRKELGPLEAARQLDCVARKDSDARCKEEWIRKCLARGEGVPLYRALNDDAFVDGGRSFTGVDIGVGKNKKDAKTVVFTIFVHPNGDVQVIGIDSGRWSGLDIVKRVVDHHVRYRSMVFVESNAAQKHLIDFVPQVAKDERGNPLPSLPYILPFNTGANKTNPVIGIESVFAEFEMGLWIIPSTADEQRPGYFQTSEQVNEWLSECENYDPDRHTGDFAMASWIAREGARKALRASAGAGATVVGDGAPKTDAEEAQHAIDIEGWEAALDPRVR